jgi:hypothetical protein
MAGAESSSSSAATRVSVRVLPRHRHPNRLRRVRDPGHDLDPSAGGRRTQVRPVRPVAARSHQLPFRPAGRHGGQSRPARHRAARNRLIRCRGGPARPARSRPAQSRAVPRPVHLGRLLGRLPHPAMVGDRRTNRGPVAHAFPPRRARRAALPRRGHDRKTRGPGRSRAGETAGPNRALARNPDGYGHRDRGRDLRRRDVLRTAAGGPVRAGSSGHRASDPRRRNTRLQPRFRADPLHRMAGHRAWDPGRVRV